jgi:O-antigen/teichoic acid export membrane protein
MGQIRKQAILSGVVIYVGFLIGFVNTWLFIKTGQQSFSPAEYGLTRLFFDIGTLMFAVASLGVTSVIYKFFPYYRQYLPAEKNDLYTWSIVVVCVGFLLVVIAGYFFEPLIIRKYSERSVLLVDYYPWVFVFGFGILLFNIMESIALTYQQPVIPNFLRETIMRFLTLILILAYFFGLLQFDQFIQLFSFQFLIIAFILAWTLRKKGMLPIHFSFSRITHKFKGKILSLSAYVYGGSIIVILSQVADSIIIASISEKGIHDAGVYNLATYIANLIQVPQRSIIAVTIPILSLAWKNKNLTEIQRLYSRSSINLLLTGLFIFISIWLNIHEAFRLLHIQSSYQAGIEVIFILGITKLIDAGTGINSQIISTSVQWRFEFMTGVVLIILFLPLNYLLIKQMGIIGSAYANLISFSVYNLIRYLFLWKKFKLQPFSQKTFLSVLIGILGFIIARYAGQFIDGWFGMILRTGIFALIFISGVFLFRLTPDAMQLYEVLKNKVKS